MSSEPVHAVGPTHSTDVRSGWLGVWSISAGTFLLVTSEFLPIGLLSPIAHSLTTSEGATGLAVTAPGFVAAVTAPFLVVLARDVGRRIIVISLTATIVFSNIIGALAPTFTVLLIGRMILGLGVGGLWSFAVAVGRRLLPDSAGARVTSIVALGISGGTVFGMPVGAVVGDWIGWRIVFAANALFGVVVLGFQFFLLPRVPAATAISTNSLVAFSRIRMAQIGFLASGLVIGGHFIAYTFLEPYLREELRLGQIGLPAVLAGYAAAGIAGSFLGERLAVHNVRYAFAAGSIFVAVGIFAAIASASIPTLAILFVLVWGLAFGAVPVCLQIWMFTASPKLFEAGSALMVSAVQIALCAGAAVGGVLVDQTGLAYAFVVSGVVCLVGGLVPLVFKMPPAPTLQHEVLTQGDAL